MILGSLEDFFPEIYPAALELKLEHSGDHATFFLELDITIKDGIYVYKLFDKRDTFSFHIVRKPSLCSIIPSRIFYATILSETCELLEPLYFLKIF